VSWEALRLMKKLNLHPRRTVRVVLWTNEENGLRGGQAYMESHREELANHVLMFESDAGVFRPTGFGFTGGEAGRARVTEIATLLRGIQADRISAAGEGADIGPSVEAAHMPSMSLDVDGNYFLLHHTPADTIDKIDPMDMSRAAAAIAVLSYVVADMADRLR
jgi:carboxypeptidase Q